MKKFINNSEQSFRVAVVSDTHGLLRGGVLDALQGVDLIVHAGDVGSLDVLQQLDSIAPVCAVRGNTDYGAGVASLPIFDCIEVGEVLIYVLHDLYLLDTSPRESNINIVVSGHTHQPASSSSDEVLYLNPGSIGPRRFDYPISMAFLDVSGSDYSVQFVEFDD